MDKQYTTMDRVTAQQYIKDQFEYDINEINDLEEIHNGSRYSKINEIKDQDDRRIKEAARLLSPQLASRAERVRADYVKLQLKDRPFDKSIEPNKK